MRSYSSIERSMDGLAKVVGTLGIVGLIAAAVVFFPKLAEEIQAELVDRHAFSSAVYEKNELGYLKVTGMFSSVTFGDVEACASKKRIKVSLDAAEPTQAEKAFVALGQFKLLSHSVSAFHGCDQEAFFSG